MSVWRISVATAVASLFSATVLLIAGQSNDAKSGLAATAIALPLYWICILIAVVLGTVSVRRFAAHEEPRTAYRNSSCLNIGIVLLMLVPYVVWWFRRS